MASKHGIISFFPETDLFPYIHNKIHWRIVTFLDDLYAIYQISILTQILLQHLSQGKWQVHELLSH